jgi:hypothetical protein
MPILINRHWRMVWRRRVAIDDDTPPVARIKNVEFAPSAKHSRHSRVAAAAATR